MCGIYCSVSRSGHILPSTRLRKLLEARGPDTSRTVLIEAAKSSQHAPFYLALLSTVLSLRGSAITEQPFQQDGSQTSLCWNGEAWQIRGQRPAGNDTSAIHELLCSALEEARNAAEGSVEAAFASARVVAQAMSEVAGPYAFVYFEEQCSRLFFARDLLGRRSLLWKEAESGGIVLSSVSDGPLDSLWREVEADGIYCIDLSLELSNKQEAAAGCDIWGDFHVLKVPYTFADAANDNNTSVIPQLSLNREMPQKTTTLDETSPSVVMLETLLRDSLQSRVLGIPEPPDQPNHDGVHHKARLAILFSGGLDCTVLARMCHDLLPSDAVIDLLNVAFQNPRAHKGVQEGAYELCPDRITGRASHAELSRICPQRVWRFVAIDVPYTEYQDHRQEIIHLMHPHNTEMDLSIASALYFAARGKGKILSSGSSQHYGYTSEARVLLSGLGADELFAGYTRHATAFKRQSYEGLLNELDLDVARLGKRNLGRDDRVISHWAKEARFPFLDEALVRWALESPVTEKCDFGIPFEMHELNHDSCASIESGKKVLRCLSWRLKMKELAKEKKRAIQFGARTAKMETGRTKGTTPLS